MLRTWAEHCGLLGDGSGLPPSAEKPVGQCHDGGKPRSRWDATGEASTSEESGGETVAAIDELSGPEERPTAGPQLPINHERRKCSDCRAAATGPLGEGEIRRYGPGTQAWQCEMMRTVFIKRPMLVQCWKWCCEEFSHGT